MTDKHISHSPLHPTAIDSTAQKQRWSNLHGSSLALALSQLVTHQKMMLIIITPDNLRAQQLTDEIRFYSHHSAPLLNFPDWETLPYDVFSPHQDIISERLTTLYHLPHLSHGILILPITTLMHRLPPCHYVQQNVLQFSIGQKISLEQFRRQLQNSGYRHTSQVVEHGEFSVRGGLLDLFPMGSDVPYRIDLNDDEIDTLRTFDPETQRSLDKVTQINLLPAREFPLTDNAIEHFRTRWRSQFQGDPRRSTVYQDVSQKFAPAGIEYYLPLFFEETATLFDYLPPGGLICTVDNVTEIADQFWQEANQRYEQLRHDIERPLLAPSTLFLQTHEVFAAIRHHPHLDIRPDHPSAHIFLTQPPPLLTVEARQADPLATLKQFLNNFQGRVLIAAETMGRRESMMELFRTHDIRPVVVENWADFLQHSAALCITVAPLERGLYLTDPLLVVICEAQLFGERVSQRRRRNKITRDTDTVVRNLTELSIGAPVVHEEHGVGRYLGLVTLTLNGITAEFLHLEYANQDKLYVPVSALHLISRFTGVDPEHAPLHRLGSGQWEKAKRKAAQKVTDVAAELLDIHAKRAARQGHAFRYDPKDYAAFVQRFPFEETPDQQEAILAVIRDMTSEKSMDRLICGDVGFGKTEVAMRAAFIAVSDGQQVAVLVPTTLLAQQHYQNFQDRFAEWPVKIEQLSRFRSKKQQETALSQIADGQIDIIIGTHKLLQDPIHFKRLGLVIIDEEHRFGVKQKERFKALRAEVDILTLTATPIPRSLNMALADLRELSIIATPPSRRLAIKTFVKEWHAPSISEAIMRELRRGGQVYFLHNDIDSIEKMAQTVSELVPEARVDIAHGQLRERELERVMRDFYHRRFNVLVCTTIIETGIDVPSANTIIIHRADRFGLAQLYQLRGRVGRSHHRAYAYLIVPPQKNMTKEAIKRLDAMTSLDTLGMGFTLATHDLEIRGAGELLGDEQSGHLQEIGYTLYTELLERAVNALKSGQIPDLERPLRHGTEIDFHVSALIPEDYLPDVHTRLILYKRIANAQTEAALDEIQVEMIDRFGLLPEAAQALFRLAELRLQVMPLGIRKIDLGETGGYVWFDRTTPVEPMQLVQLVQRQPSAYRFDSEDRLRLQWSMPDFASRCEAVLAVLRVLQVSLQAVF
ncbi:transcription-repair coupling factor [Thioflexithrix psekupsensis]|uniref:Transcription-repair-coupling factor n=1 Tax=Thioflexithrix psekupsensis TaxID=1570016 RepID=A0A251XAS7_9GAMM|nr:transcription-repair coupling factor [Thioflexithrix psekupsensis]OUD15444.1 transcription-repair coupling factor [Thioflexithrix psekupsensis]